MTFKSEYLLSLKKKSCEINICGAPNNKSRLFVLWMFHIAGGAPRQWVSSNKKKSQTPPGCTCQEYGTAADAEAHCDYQRVDNTR